MPSTGANVNICSIGETNSSLQSLARKLDRGVELGCAGGAFRATFVSIVVRVLDEHAKVFRSLRNRIGRHHPEDFREAAFLGIVLAVTRLLHFRLSVVGRTIRR